MSSESAVKKNIQKLQRAIVDGLEDVKALDIQVFNTEGLSPLFERVIIASGSSNRQTKALAASVRDAVRDAGFEKPRIEGEENGEWIIVDCGQAVVHVMQPVIRQYYRLEDIWGETPVRLKSGEARHKAARAAAEKANAASAAAGAQAKPVAKKSARKSVAALEPVEVVPAARKAPARSATQAPAKAAARSGVKSAPKPKAKSTAGALAPSATAKAPARKAAAKPAAKVAVVKVGAPVKKAVAKKAAGSSSAKPTPKPTPKPAARKSAPKKKA